MPWFPIVLTAHVALAVSLLLPSLLLPFLLRPDPEPGEARRSRSAPDEAVRHPVVRLLRALQGTGSVVIGLGLAITGAGLVLALGTELLTKRWLLAALVIYAANLLVAALVSRPNLRRLAGVRRSDGGAAWRRRARRQRWIAYAMALATGVIGLLMSAKPEL